MKLIAITALGLGVFLTGMTLPITEANAVVCARGVYRAGCVGPRGAVGVVRAPVYRRGFVRVRRW